MGADRVNLDGAGDRSRLSDAWDRRVRGEPAGPSGVDPGAAEAIRRLHALDAADRRADPDPVFVARLERALRASAARVPPALTAHRVRVVRAGSPVASRSRGDGAAPWWPTTDASERSTPAAPAGGRLPFATNRLRWAWPLTSTLAIAAVLVGLVGFLSYRSSRMEPARPLAQAPVAAVASPTPDVPAPEECVVAPRDFEETVALANAQRPQMLPTTPDVPMPGQGPTDPVDAATVAAVNATARHWVACLNAGDQLRQWALISDDGLRRTVWNTDGESDGDDGIFAWDPSPEETTPKALPAGEQIEFVGLHDVWWLGDGRVSARVVGAEVGSRQVREEAMPFRLVDGRWLIDAFVWEMAESRAIYRPATTPTPDVPAPDACTGVPRDLDETVALVNASRQARARATPPPVEPVDAAIVEALSAVVAQWEACLNAGDVLRQWALVTDDGLARVIWEPDFDGTDGSSWDPDPATPLPLTGVDRIGIGTLRDVRRLEDGRVVARVVASSNEGTVSWQDVFSFELVDGRWLIDDVVPLEWESVSATPAPAGG